MRHAAIAISTTLIAASTLFAGASGAEHRHGSQAMASLATAQLAADTRLLTWPGKQPEPDSAPAPDMAPTPPPAPPPAQPAPPPAPVVAPVSLPPAATPPIARAAPPTPAPTPPTPQAAPTAQASAPARPWNATGAGLPAHIYSVAREFGLKPDPDPAPLPPQFFADQPGSDLAAPPPPLNPHAVPGSQTINSTASANTPANRARAIALDTPSPDGGGN
jgi:hypothetical protein